MNNNNNSSRLSLKQKIAKLRHVHTVYNKHVDLMYNDDGSQTELRKTVNHLLYKIASGELTKSYLSGVNSEIKFAQQKYIKEHKKRKKHKHGPSIAEQQAALLRGVQKMQAFKIESWQFKYLNAIRMRPHDLHKLYRKALPKPE